MKVYSLVGKKLTECIPDELIDSPVGMIVDEKEEMIRLILTPEARKKQREVLMQQSAEFNKSEFAGTYLVSILENPSIVNTFLKEIKEGKTESEPVVEKPKKPKKKKKKKKKAETDEQQPPETHILERWDKALVKKVVEFLDGKDHASLIEIKDHLDVTEGETYWVTQDLIYIGTLPGRWIGYDDGSWYYQVIKEQPLSKSQKPKKKTPKKTASKKKSPKKSSGSKKSTKSTTTKSKSTSTKKKSTSKGKTTTKKK